MSDLDPATLAKFQKFQAMLAESPEIVEALNSPEILALAALAADKKNQAGPSPVPEPQPESQPEPAPAPHYPTVGYGHSDEVSVMSEMTTPTVMTRQTVEEDEFYPEVNGSGVSSSGLEGGPRRIGMNIGVSAFEGGGPLPPPPPKAKTRLGAVRSGSSRRSRAMTRQNLTKIPMSKISEHDDSTTSESTESELKKKRPLLVAKKANWKPRAPAFTGIGAKQEGESVALTSNSTGARNRSGSRGRGVGRNRSMPTSLPTNSKASDQSHSSHGKKSSSKSVGSGSVASFGSDDIGDDVQLSDIEDDVELSDIDDDSAQKTKPQDESNVSSSVPKTKNPTKSPQLSPMRTPRGRSVAKMRPVPKSSSGSSSPGKGLKSSEHLKRPTRSKSRERKPISLKVTASKKPALISDDDEASHKESLQRARGEEASDGTSISENSKSKSKPLISTNGEKVRLVARRWSTNVQEGNNVPPAFRNRSSSQQSKDVGIESKHGKHPLKLATHTKNVSNSASNSVESKKSSTSTLSDSSELNEKELAIPRSNPYLRKVNPVSSASTNEEATKTKVVAPEDEDEEDYVPQTIRKPGTAAKKAVEEQSLANTKTDGKCSIPEPKHYAVYLSNEFRQGDTSRPDGYLPGTDPSGTGRKKKEQAKKRWGNPSFSGTTRVDDWLGSGKTQKRTWRVKGT